MQVLHLIMSELSKICNICKSKEIYIEMRFSNPVSFIKHEKWSGSIKKGGGRILIENICGKNNCVGRIFSAASVLFSPSFELTKWPALTPRDMVSSSGVAYSMFVYFFRYIAGFYSVKRFNTVKRWVFESHFVEGGEKKTRVTNGFTKASSPVF